MGWKGTLYETPLWALGRFFGRGTDPQRHAPREILVLRPNDYGDLLTTTPIFEALRRRYPTSRIVAGVGHWGRAVVENNPYVDEIVEIDAPWNNKFVPDQSLRNGFGFIWNSPAGAGVAQARRLRCRHRRTRQSHGCDADDASRRALPGRRAWLSRRLERMQQTHRVFDCARRPCGAGASRVARRDQSAGRAAAVVSERGGTRGGGATLGRRGHRRPAGAFAGRLRGGTGRQVLAGARAGRGIARHRAGLRGKRYRTGCGDGGRSADVGRAAEVLAHCGDTGRIRSLVGQTTLRTTFALAEQADVVLTNPSMLLHVAAAFSRPTVAVLGGPFADAALHDTVWGYPAPYRSVGPAKVVRSDPATHWPPVGDVVDTVLQTIGVPVAAWS